MKNISWFKEIIAPDLGKYEVKYKIFQNGDFGDLDQVEFNSEKIGGEIDFWSTGWLGIHLVDYIKGEELLNVLLEPSKTEDKDRYIGILMHHLLG